MNLTGKELDRYSPRASLERRRDPESQVRPRMPTEPHVQPAGLGVMLLVCPD